MITGAFLAEEQQPESDLQVDNQNNDKDEKHHGKKEHEKKEHEKASRRGMIRYRTTPNPPHPKY